MNRSDSRSPRVMFYVQHLLGIGHIARASRISRALADDGFDLLMVTGGVAVPGFPAEGVAHVQLPAMAAGEGGFSDLVDENGKPVDDAFREMRRRALIETFLSFSPDILIIEAFPFGRRQVRFELVPLLEHIATMEERPLVLASVRDILQAHNKPGRDEETVATIERYFDRVLIHGDAGFVRLEESFPLAAKIAGKVVYTGLVAAPPPIDPRERFDIVVSAGGGAVGGTLLAAASEAARMLDPALTWLLIAGPNLNNAAYEKLLKDAPANVRIERFRKDFPSLLKAARLSISQAGYNTVCDILRAGCRSILIPFAAGGETEQGERAARLEALALASVVEESVLEGHLLAATVSRELAKGPPPAFRLDLDGAANTARIVKALYNDGITIAE